MNPDEMIGEQCVRDHGALRRHVALDASVARVHGAGYGLSVAWQAGLSESSGAVAGRARLGVGMAVETF